MLPLSEDHTADDLIGDIAAFTDCRAASGLNVAEAGTLARPEPCQIGISETPLRCLCTGYASERGGQVRQDTCAHFSAHDPVAIMLIQDDALESALLLSRPWRTITLFTLAGFVDQGELEEAVRREVMEEAG